MEKGDRFFLAVLATVLLVRLFILLMPVDFFIFQDYYHHIYVGILLIFVFALLNYELHLKLFYPFAIAIGLVVDELVYLLPFFMGNTTKGDYFSSYSLFFMIFGLVIVYVIRELFVKEIKDTQD